MSTQRLCRICKKRPAWRDKNCPPGICKRCYHKHVWPDRPSVRMLRQTTANEPDRLALDEDLNPNNARRHPIL